ncbi:hypothetical protein [Symbiobacterium terraclitae]|uniref:hypothetical protein n=1 Tax=Symbiobacterium terraclitae TaxID=557451 RepID=UPI0035B559C9
MLEWVAKMTMFADGVDAVFYPLDLPGRSAWSALRHRAFYPLHRGAQAAAAAIPEL